MDKTTETQVYIWYIFSRINYLFMSNLIVYKLLGGIIMYVEQLWRYFEETGSIETYLDIKRYERLYNEHTSSVIKDNDIEQVSDSDLDGMK